MKKLRIRALETFSIRFFMENRKPEARVFTQRRRRRLGKRHLKIEFALSQTLSRFTPSRLIRQMLANFFGVDC